MRLLLDTHSALWMFAGSAEISEDLQKDLTDPENEVFFSDASAWEIVIKHALGKLLLPAPPEIFVPEMVGRHGLEQQPITWNVIFEWGKLPFIHRDPFDRLLVSQAREEGFLLVSRDTEICQYEVAVHWR